MKRGKWVWDDEKKCLVDYDDYKPDVDAPYVLTDEIPGGILSNADRKIYTSKRALRNSYKRLGKIEVGNDTDWLLKDKPRPEDDPKYQEQLEADIQKSYYEVRDGMAPLTELDKERCKIMNKQIKENHDNRERDSFGRVRE